MTVVQVLVDAARRGRAAAARGKGEAGLWRLGMGMVLRLSWGVADQAVSSLTNFAVSIFIVRTLGAAQFGAFSLAYVTYGFALNASRGLSTDPLLVRFSGTDLPAWRRAVTDCTGTAAIVGLVTGTCALGSAAVLSGTSRGAFLGLGLTLPGLLLQDSWRYSFFALGRGGQAFLNDTIWAAALIPLLVCARATGHADVFWFVLAWGAAATVAAAAGSLQSRVVPSLPGAWRWVSRHRDLGWRYLAEGTATSAAAQLRGYGVGIMLGLAAVGYLQASSTLTGPLTILFLGMGLVTLPEAARVLRRSPRHLPLFCLLVSGAMSAAALGWGVALLIALPRGLGNLVLGPVWRPTYPLVLPTTLFVIGQGVTSGAGTGLHALGAARRSLRAVIFSSVAYVVCALVGTYVDGVVGAMDGTAFATWLGALVLWWQLRAALRESARVPSEPQVRLGDTAAQRSSTPATTGLPPPAAERQPVPHRTVRVPLVGKPLAAGMVAVVAAGVTAGLLLMLPGTQRTPDALARTAHTAQPTHPDIPSSLVPSVTRMLRPASAVAFDPYEDGRGDNSQLADRAIDGNPATAWRTDWYATATFGNLTPGTGLLLDMGQPVTLTSVRLLLGGIPGTDLEVRVGDAAGSLTDLVPVARATDVAGDVNLPLARAASGRYVLIWITRLPPSSAGEYQASIYGVTLTGWYRSR